MIPAHFMRFGIHSEAQYFTHEFRACYDGIVLNGNLVVYTLDGVCSFMEGLVAQKKYFIDPITHAFAHDPQHISRRNDEGDYVIKPAIKALAHKFGSPVEQILEEESRAMEPEDFRRGKSMREFTERVLGFQRDAINEGLGAANLAKYLPRGSTQPCLLIAPYFYMSSNTVDVWIDLNLEFVRTAREFGSGIPVFAEILVANDAFVDHDTRDVILDKYRSCEADGVILWVEGYSEHSAPESVLKGHREFTRALRKAGKSVVVMYGGYFSTAQLREGVTGVCHGPGYGETREVTPVGGGIPKPSFYMPSMHARLPFRQVAYALRRRRVDSAQAYYDTVCNCSTCKQVVGNNLGNFLRRYGEAKVGMRRDGVAFEYSTTEAKKLLVAHYIHSKQREFAHAASREPSDLAADLLEEYKRNRTLFSTNEAAHLLAWSKALR